MSRVHADAVEVKREDDVPAQFLWRGRLYLVREVLSRWTQSGGWWRSAAVQSLTTGEAAAAAVDDPLAPLQTAPLPPSPKWGQRAWGEPAPDVGVAVGPATIDDGEQDWFRVEAGCPPFTGPSSAGTGVFDLCFHWSSGRWTLARVLD